MTTTTQKRHRAKRWFRRNSLSFVLLGIIILSMTVGALGCLTIVSAKYKTPLTISTESCDFPTKPNVITTNPTPMTKPTNTPSLETIPEFDKPFYFNVPLTHDIQDFIRDKCKEYGVSMELIIAIIDKESSFRPNVVSGTNDYGYMQINKINFETLTEKLGITDFLDPYNNILCGIDIISGHLEKTNGNIELALMRYNCGATGAKRLWDKGTYSTPYSSSIMALYESYLEQAKEK